MGFSPSMRRFAVAGLPQTYVSPHGPKYNISRHFHGLNLTTASRYAYITSTFGISAAVFAVFFFGEVPRVRKDILMQVPLLKDYFNRTIVPEDNPY